MADKSRLRVIGTHKSAHRDELTAIAIILFPAFGKRRWSWPKDEPPEVRVVTDTEAAELTKRDDVILIGIGGGPFDEHKAEGRLEGVCACDLVARHLGIGQMPELQEILDDVRRADTQPGQRPFELAQIIKDHYAYSRETVEGGKVIPKELVMLRLVRETIRARYLRQVEFHQTCAAEFAAKGRLVNINDLSIVFVESDLPTMGGYCRWKHKAEMVVIRASSGHIRVFSSNKSWIVKAIIPHLARLIVEDDGVAFGLGDEVVNAALARMDELIMAGCSVELPGVPHWYWEAQMVALLNSTTTHPDLPPTRLTLEEVEELVKKAVEKMAA